MVSSTQLADRQTSADMVFDALYDEIVSLRLLPGMRISETEIAKRFDLSRQPVREAFSHLNRLGLIRVSPQRPTIVRYFSMEEILNARFIRAAIETDVLAKACEARDALMDQPLKDCLSEQKAAMSDNNGERFHELDYEFHRLLCQSARAEFAFEYISSSKAQVDRLCMLALTSKSSMETLYDDHEKILAALFSGDNRAAEDVLRLHLERLDPTIDAVYEKHQDYFE